MLSELCKELNNWFEVRDKDGRFSGRIFDAFTVKDGALTVPGAKVGQYIRICDSTFNDGVYKYPVTGLTDETFDGAVWLMNVPQDVIDLDKEIDDWKGKYEAVLNSPYQSESFGGYSYSKASASSQSAAGGSTATWQSTFADRLSHWRKA